jgi:hypothetical protein
MAGMPSSGAHDEQLSQCFQESIGIFQNTTMEQCSAIAQHTVSDKVAQPYLAPSCIKEVSPKKRRKQCHQETATYDNGGVNRQAGGSNVEHTMVVTGSSKS